MIVFTDAVGPVAESADCASAEALNAATPKISAAIAKRVGAIARRERKPLQIIRSRIIRYMPADPAGAEISCVFAVLQVARERRGDSTPIIPSDCSSVVCDRLHPRRQDAANNFQ